MSAAFTPGPWEAEGREERPRPWVGRLSENRFAALACGDDDDEAWANARLIAAAPELYEALEVATHLLDRYRKETPLGHQPHMIAHSAEAAVNVGTALLAKARGAEPTNESPTERTGAANNRSGETQ